MGYRDGQTLDWDAVKGREAAIRNLVQYISSFAPDNYLVGLIRATLKDSQSSVEVSYLAGVPIEVAVGGNCS